MYSMLHLLGQALLSTLPFIEAMTTKTFIMYTLDGEISKNSCVRIRKFCNRGFGFLAPYNFDGNFDELMSQEYLPEYRIEDFHYIDDDGEVRVATKEVYLRHEPNVDTFRLQEKFILTVCPQLLNYR